jgi:hypothetical protein
MKRSGLFRLLLASALITAAGMIACKSGPTAETAAEEVPVVAQEEPQPSYEEGSPPVNITQEMYDETLAEVRLFIDNLNTIIRNKNYASWKNTLSDGFFNQISSPEFLANASESAVLKARKIVLKTPNDYFLQVVVPSRSQSRADEIEFTDIHTVKVFYREAVRKDNQTTGETRRLRLYELRKTDGTWKIID